MSGIYIHIPFCKKACHYCNFHFTTSLLSKEKMLSALAKEIVLTNASCVNSYAGEICETIYFGGGTPSILETTELKMIMDTLRENFHISPDAEITVEANPDDISPGKLQDFRQIGINRLSVGIQSFSEQELLWMNRTHTAADSIRCISEIKAAGFTNFSVDLIYGSPLLNHSDWEKNVALVIEKDVPHVSCYALTVEPKTALEKMIAQNKKEQVNADKQAEQFLLLMDWMDQGGYEHYEISNFSKPNMQSKHNSSYWQGKYYYGFGPSAHSFNGKRRKWNIANNALYIESLNRNIIPFEEEILTEIQLLNEYIMTSLRTMDGIDLKTINVKFGGKYVEGIKNMASKYLATGKLIINDSKMILTREGKLFADGIAADLFF